MAFLLDPHLRPLNVTLPKPTPCHASLGLGDNQCSDDMWQQVIKKHLYGQDMVAQDLDI